MDVSARDTDVVRDVGPDTAKSTLVIKTIFPDNDPVERHSPSTDTGPEEPSMPSWRIRRMLGFP